MVAWESLAKEQQALPLKRWKKPTLFVDLVPSSAWFSNLRSILTDSEWGVCKKLCYTRANYKCEVCGGVGAKWPVEAHERWIYTLKDGVRTQKLVDVVALCPACHEVSHIGLACKNGREAVAIKHLMKVNKWTKQEAYSHVNEAFAKFERRSKRPWTLDATWILSGTVKFSTATINKIKSLVKNA